MIIFVHFFQNLPGNKIEKEHFFRPVKIQLNKTNNVREDGIKKIPQSQTKKVDCSKPHRPKKDFRFSDTMFGN